MRNCLSQLVDKANYDSKHCVENKIMIQQRVRTERICSCVLKQMLTLTYSNFLKDTDGKKASAENRNNQKGKNDTKNRMLEKVTK